MRSVLLECTMQLCLGSRTLWARSVSGHAPWGFSVALAGGCRVLVGCQRRSCFSLVRTVCAADIPAVVRLVDSDGDLAGDVQTHPQPTVDEAHVPWPKANRTESKAKAISCDRKFWCHQAHVHAVAHTTQALAVPPLLASMGYEPAKGGWQLKPSARNFY